MTEGLRTVGETPDGALIREDMREILALVPKRQRAKFKALVRAEWERKGVSPPDLSWMPE